MRKIALTGVIAPKKNLQLFFLFLIFSLSSIQPAIANNPREEKLCSIRAEKKIEKKIGLYRIRISYAYERMCQRLEIFRNDRIVFREGGIGDHYFLGSNFDDYNEHFLVKLTGHGSQLVVSKWTGGAHCCTSLLVFDLGNKLKEIGEIYGGNFAPELVDLNHDGIPEIRITDDFLAYRFSSFASSAKADVILKFSADHFSIAPEFMKKAPDLKALYAEIPHLRKQMREPKGADWPPPSIVQTMTDLIFTGNKELAFTWMDQVWPPEVAGKPVFLKSYREALVESKYYAEFKK